MEQITQVNGNVSTVAALGWLALLVQSNTPHLTKLHQLRGKPRRPNDTPDSSSSHQRSEVPTVHIPPSLHEWPSGAPSSEPPLEASPFGQRFEPHPFQPSSKPYSFQSSFNPFLLQPPVNELGPEDAAFDLSVSLDGLPALQETSLVVEKINPPHLLIPKSIQKITSNRMRDAYGIEYFLIIPQQ